MTCCWSGPVTRSALDGVVEEGHQRGRRVGGDRREPAGVQVPRVAGDRRHHQQERHAAGARHQGRRGHRPGPDRQAGAGGAELQGPGPAARRPGRVLAGVRGADRRGRDAAWPGWRPAGRQRGDAVRHHRCGHHLPGRARPRHPNRDHGGQRPGGRAGDPVQERHGAGDLRPHRHGGHGQDRHADQGRTRSHRPGHRRHGRRRGAAAGGGDRARVRTPAGRSRGPPRRGQGHARPGGVRGQRIRERPRARRHRATSTATWWPSATPGCWTGRASASGRSRPAARNWPPPAGPWSVPRWTAAPSRSSASPTPPGPPRGRRGRRPAARRDRGGHADRRQPGHRPPHRRPARRATP